MIKNAFVTGGSRGIGKAIAVALAKAGINVVISYNKNEKDALAVLQEIKENGVQGMIVWMDQKIPLSIYNAVADIKKNFGLINILVNNAGMAQKKTFGEITVDDWDIMMATNLRGPFILCQEVIQDMVKQNWGRIVNISSVAGESGGLHQVHYAVSKAGLINLTRSLARVYSARSVTINAVAPNTVITDMTKVDLKIDFLKQDFSDIPAGRVGTLEEVASAVVFLCSDTASYITGQTINVNGGAYFG
ncbi:MAG TPA: 3-oxoacyl-ACP reductase family protein [Candidatus Paceibacterota bacterium]